MRTLPAIKPPPGRGLTGVLKAEVMSLGDNSRFVVTSLTDPAPQLLYQDLYCASGQDENYIKAIKNDLASDRTSKHTFLANHLRLLYACATYVLIHSLRENTWCALNWPRPSR
jgi:DDE family transposase